MAQQIRRVVTGHDENGTAVVIRDSVSEHILQRPNRPGVTLTNLWQVTKAPAQMETPDDPVDGDFVLHPPKNGSVFRTVQFDPEDPEVMAKLDGKAAFAEMGASANIVEGARHPFMHRTDSVDYAVILTGEIYMMMDDTEILLKAGDTVVQQGTNHAWSNRGTEPCIIAFVLVDAE
ncbi:MAG: cupin domain-containing protein [Rhodospirillales bacterium]|nr:cupin domain-containing protein [Rhodospirillales bacterium]